MTIVLLTSFFKMYTRNLDGWKISQSLIDTIGTLPNLETL